MVKEFVPRSENGKVDWLGYFRTVWPVALVLVGAIVANEVRYAQLEMKLKMEGRAETPEEKGMRIRYICGEMIDERVPPKSVTDAIAELKEAIRSMSLKLDRHLEYHGGQ